MVAYLLCAGFGTRMQPLTENLPKSLLPVAGRPLVDYLFEEIRSSAVVDTIHVVVNHRDAPDFRTWAANWRPILKRDDIRLTLHDNGVTTPDERRGAVGDLQYLLDRTDLPDDGALVTGGDSLYRFPLSPVLEAFTGRPHRVLALYQPDRRKRAHSSLLHLDGHRVTGLTDNPDTHRSKWICPSFHLLAPSGLRAVPSYLSKNGDPDALGAFIDFLAREQRVEAVRLPRQGGLRLHCNTPEDLRHAQRLLESEVQYTIDETTIRGCLHEPGS